jgi:nitrite reductase/ring-hydroxylating ferredoxin subunit
MTELKWYKVFSTEEASRRIPVGKLQLVRLGEQRICIVHSEKGYSAVSDTCPHLGASLSHGSVNYLNEIICPWHGYQYNLVHGRECQQRTEDLEVHNIELRDDGLFLGVLK